MFYSKTKDNIILSINNLGHLVAFNGTFTITLDKKELSHIVMIHDTMMYNHCVEPFDFDIVAYSLNATNSQYIFDHLYPKEDIIIQSMYKMFHVERNDNYEYLNIMHKDTMSMIIKYVDIEEFLKIYFEESVKAFTEIIENEDGRYSLFNIYEYLESCDLSSYNEVFYMVSMIIRNKYSI